MFLLLCKLIWSVDKLIIIIISIYIALFFEVSQAAALHVYMK